MSNPLQQTIEALAKEKGIEPETVISAIEEAVATASRKYYKTGENLKTRFNTETGQVDLFARQAGRAGRDRPRDRDWHRRRAADVSAALRRRGRQQHRTRRRDGVPQGHRGARAHRGADRQAGDLPEGPRSGAGKHLRRVQPADWRGRQRHGQALRERRHHPRDRPHRSGPARARNSRAPRATRRPIASGR